MFSNFLKLDSLKGSTKAPRGKRLPRIAKGQQYLSRAMEFMSERRWSEAARLFRIILSEKPDPSIWMQYGHALKEAGFFNQADTAYSMAEAALGESVDFHLQRGHLRKITGQFVLAKESYNIARDLTDSDKLTMDDVSRNISSISGLTRELAPSRNDSLIIFFSSASKIGSVLDVSLDTEVMGRANYSYSFAMRGFQRAADELGIQWSFLSAPHYISDLSNIAGRSKAVHINFSPPKHARLLKGAYNILAFAWEFAALTAEPNLAHAFADPTQMFKLFDEIWVPSSFGVDVVRKYTERKVSFVPSPIISGQEELNSNSQLRWRRSKQFDLDRVEWVPLSIFPRLQLQFDVYARERARKLFEIVHTETISRQSNVYLTVFNINDLRKQIRPLIEGFLQFQKKVGDAVLLVKTVSDIATNRNVNWWIMNRQFERASDMVQSYFSESVWITNSVLSEQELDSLYSMASFYLCTSYCEGQNLPLLEAMKRGVIPISPSHTAMFDYINEENSIVLPFTTGSCEDLMEVYHLSGHSTNLIRSEDVTEALLTASNLDAQSREILRKNAIRTITENYSSSILKTALTNLSGKNAGVE